MTKEDSGKFAIEAVFDVTGRGTVLTGRILEGKIRVGFLTEPLQVADSTKKRFAIRSLTFADGATHDQSRIGLIMDFLGQDVQAYLRGKIIRLAEQ